MNSTRFSPIKTLAISLALALGILVSDLIGRSIVPTTRAQVSTECSRQLAVESVPVGTAVPVAEGRISGAIIEARGVIVSGEIVDAVFEENVRLINGVIVSGEEVLADGVVVGEQPCANGVIVSGELISPYGVIVSGEDEAIIDDGSARLGIMGGTVEGDNVRVENGVIRGDNLRVVGGYVVGSALRLSGASLSVSFAPVE